MRTGLLRRHPWAVLWSAAVVTAAASVGRDLSDGGGAGISGGWELAWLLLTVVAGLVCAAAVLQLARGERAPHVPRRRVHRTPQAPDAAR